MVDLYVACGDEADGDIENELITASELNGDLDFGPKALLLLILTLSWSGGVEATIITLTTEPQQMSGCHAP
jgi:hypothetical protein